MRPTGDTTKQKGYEMEETILDTVQRKWKSNTYVMSCYLTQADLYSEMKEHLEKLAKEHSIMIEGIKDIRNRCHINDTDQIENNLNELLRGVYRR